jgi:hypothetical protein
MVIKELYNSDAQFHVIVSSIQFLSNKHGFETWGIFRMKLKTRTITGFLKSQTGFYHLWRPTHFNISQKKSNG